MKGFIFKKCVSLALSVAVLLASVAITGGFGFKAAADDVSVWDGTKSASLTKAWSTNNDNQYFWINSAEDLALALGTYNAYAGATFYLTTDIYLNSDWENYADWATSAPANNWNSRGGSGVHGAGITINGNGHIIYGLYDYNAAGDAGLTYRTPNYNTGDYYAIKFMNLGIDYAYIKGKNAGAFMAQTPPNHGGAYFENCFVGEHVIVSTTDSNEGFIGGFIGKVNASSTATNRPITFKNCYSLVQLDTASASSNILRYGSFLGFNRDLNSCSMEHCYAKTDARMFGYVQNTSQTGTVDKATNYISNGINAARGGVTYATNCTDANMVGMNAIYNMPGLGSAYVATDSYPQLKLFNPEGFSFDIGNAYFAGGEGTAESPYLIANAEQLKNAIGYFGFNGRYFKLIDDIYVNDVDAVNWSHRLGTVNEGYTPEPWFGTKVNASTYVGSDGSNGTFSGHIDGNGYSVNGIYYPYHSQWTTLENSYTIRAAFIPCMSSGSVSNLTISNSYIYSNNINGSGVNAFSGGIVSTVTGTATFENIIIDDTVAIVMFAGNSQSNSSAAGIAGNVAGTSNVTIRNVGVSAYIEYAATTTATRQNVGAFVAQGGSTTVTLNNCYANHTTYPGKTISCYSNCASSLTYNCTNVYTAFDDTTKGPNIKLTGSPASVISLADTIPSGFSTDVWYATSSVPKLCNRGMRICDINEDGIALNDDDCTRLFDVLLETTTSSSLADVNADGYVDVRDLVRLEKKLLSSGLFSEYELDKFVSPVWKGNTVYYETVSFVEDSEGNVSDAGLVRTPDVVIAVRSGDMQTVYEEGRDYTVVNGRLKLTPESRIKYLPYSEYITTTPSKFNAAYHTTDYTFINEINYYDYQYSVCYTHSDTWSGPEMASQLNELPNTKAKLNSGSPLKIVFYGDSITSGCDTSGGTDITASPGDYNNYGMNNYDWSLNNSHLRAPHMPSWPSMVSAKLQDTYGSTVTKVNRASISTSAAAANNDGPVNKWITPETPDLVVVAFGMNGCTGSADYYETNIKGIIDKVRAASGCENTEFLLVSTMEPNQEIYPSSSSSLVAFEQKLSDIADTYEGVGVVKVNSLFNYINDDDNTNYTTGKKFLDYTLNATNHPSDFGVMLYAQSVLSALGVYDE